LSSCNFENNFSLKDQNLWNYIETIRNLMKRYSSAAANDFRNPPLQVLLGLEIDFIPGVCESFGYYRKNFSFDYLIGSVHLVKNEESGKLWFIDGPDISIYDEGLISVFEGNIRSGVTAYYRQIQSMVVTHHPDIIGHLDKIKMYNRGRYFSETDSWYVELVDETLELIKDTGCVVEVNTRGLYKKRADDFFPGKEILSKIKHLRIPVTIVSDAHKPGELSLGYEDAIETLKKMGFEKILCLSSAGWAEATLE